MNMITAPLSLDQADIPENTQVLGYRGLSNTKKSGQSIDTQGIGVTLVTKEPHQLETGGVSKSFK
jgi:hypothetical protein